jgi:uncharacterized protein
MGTALITGASAGLGQEFAWQLATAHHDVVLVARDVERLERLAGQLRAAAGVHVEVLQADLADRAQVDRVAERLRQTERPVGLLVNNAGFGPGDAFVGSDLARQETALDVMVRAVLVLSHTAAQVMVERGRGAILNVSSVAGLTGASPYSAHKSWVTIFTEGLAGELRGTGVTATVLCPGMTRTEFHERAGLDRDVIPGAMWLNAEDVVSAALSDVRRGTVISTPSLRYQVVSQTARMLPRPVIRYFARQRSTRSTEGSEQ